MRSGQAGILRGCALYGDGWIRRSSARAPRPNAAKSNDFNRCDGRRCDPGARPAPVMAARARGRGGPDATRRGLDATMSYCSLAACVTGRAAIPAAVSWRPTVATIIATSPAAMMNSLICIDCIAAPSLLLEGAWAQKVNERSTLSPVKFRRCGTVTIRLCGDRATVSCAVICNSFRQIADIQGGLS